MIPAKKLLIYLKAYRRDLTIVMLSLLLVATSLLMMGKAFKRLIDYGLNDSGGQSINDCILSMVILIIIFSTASFFRAYFINNIAEKAVGKIKLDAYNSLVKRNIVNFEELKIGDIICRLTFDIELIAKFIVNFLSFFIRNLIMFVGASALMFVQSPKLALITLLTIPLLLVPLMKFSKYVRTLSKNALQAQASIASSLEESFVNIRIIQAFNQQENKIIDFKEQISLYLLKSAKRLKIRSLFFAIAISAILFSIIIVIWEGSIDIAKGSLSPGQMISFIYFAVIAGFSSGGILEIFSEMHSPLAAVERVFALIDSSVCSRNISLSVKNISDFKISKSLSIKKSQAKKPQSIEFQEVCFFYPSRPDILVLNNLSFSIQYGVFIGIIGKSGVGKSTIMQILMKFYYSSKGLVKIADEDILTINTEQLRSQIAYVSQEVNIFSGSIKLNIAFSNPDASEEQILYIAKLTGIIEFAEQFKEGLDTEIGERGVRLSGGQKQRIIIARALLYQPKILLLDEAMSALDSESEQKLLGAIRQLMKGKTILSIAHRISSIQYADEILIVDNGAVVAKGSHDLLVVSSELYRGLCKEQA